MDFHFIFDALHLAVELLTSLEQVIRFLLMLKQMFLSLLRAHRGPRGLLCRVFFIASSSGCHSADRCILTWTTTLSKHMETHLTEGLKSSWRWSPAKPAGSLTVFIFITHRIIGTDRAQAHTAEEKKKKICL